MSKIKINSNPYQKVTLFQSWDESSGRWINIDHENNSNSGLLSEELLTGFFPFRVKRIVDAIATEYASASEKVELMFEGTDDEYRELEAICNDGCYQNQIFSSKSSIYLENARDILPDIIDVFRRLSPLVAESVSDKAKVRRELEKFSDASNDVIPICVVGNYSSGKSTFINALIGYELLPSSDEPTTAKIYKISQSDHADRALIKFEYAGKNVWLRFYADSYKFASDPIENPLTEELKSKLNEIMGAPIPVMLNNVLSVINSHANRTKDDTISDLIEVEAPFDDDGLWGKIKNKFVIFDTPGSNSVSNVKHYQVLKKAMEDLSNGLPIFVSEYDSVDSTDNDHLYQDINNMDELDNRFTMIIVNKADSASLKKNGHTDDDRDRILSLAIPRKLYSGGVYFVSSIVGLGAKNDEAFISEHNAEVFEDQRAKYADPNSKFYKQLYRYNIMPEQIRQKYDLLSEKHGNLLYANSGLYCVEQAIETFAGVYSHYNKCQQSQLFLGKVIEITSDEIVEAKHKKEEYRERIHANLEKEKSALIDKLGQHSEALNTQYVQEYPAFMSVHKAAVNSAFTNEKMKEKEEDFRRSEEDERDMEAHEREVSESWKTLLSSFKGNISKAVSERNLSAIRKIGTDVSDGIRDITEKSSERRQAKNDVETATSDELISFIKESFTTNVNDAQELLENHSREFWALSADNLKRELSNLVSDSAALTTEERGELTGIIIKYQELAFSSKAELIFDKEAFRRRVFGDTNRLDTDKLTRRYNDEIKMQIKEIYTSFESSHKISFNEWMSNLLTIIEENIVEFSPQLHNQSEIIREETARIADLESRMVKLNEYTAQVKRMMDWMEA